MRPLPKPRHLQMDQIMFEWRQYGMGLVRGGRMRFGGVLLLVLARAGISHSLNGTMGGRFETGR
jgi:hypothetical protein